MNAPLAKAAWCLTTTMLALATFHGAAWADEAEKRVPLKFAGGHEIGKDDFGRPINLMAAGLGVKPDEFRKAFSGVTPARGREPSGQEQRRNKAALMKVLAPLGVTNERMDEVANYYRFRPQAGELWPTKPAKGYAVLEGGKVTKLVVSDPGAGYNTPPEVTIPGMDSVKLKTTLSFGKDLAKNGGVAAVEQVREKAK